MATFTLTAQDVNGDPLQSGGNINIVTNAWTSLTFTDVDGKLGTVQPGEYVSLDGGTTQLTYAFLGFGNVRGDPTQQAGFIRVDLGDGTFLTFAIDMNADADDTPDLQNGNTQLNIDDLVVSPPAPWPVPPCFTPGTLIATPDGPRKVEEIGVGDLVTTMDHGAQPVRWAGRRRVGGMDRFAPVRISEGVLGNRRALLVSPQHRMLVSGWPAELVTGEGEVLAAAAHLVGMPGIARAPMAEVDYLHLMFDRHEIIFAEGAATESFHPGEVVLESDRALREEILAIFPELATAAARRRSRTARPVANAREARLFVA
ncbi:Hint domain-containing protein [Defluviimonas salinarum]|uniref:Hint domain-containing protein n=1 Tax=Defluviimonas salinarum TaxID=2992147 RepID=A0ABT3J120_9RHOB|nr:Hint domain-containing protein [Defluviimonas salinarum]MCW3781373.1 Hint domain-containing protein [Defluviimonas salinarum]